MKYRMVNETYGAGPFEPNTLSAWVLDIESTCRQNGWDIPTWQETNDGRWIDKTTGQTLLEPVEE